jgi:hypothetical protein
MLRQKQMFAVLALVIPFAVAAVASSTTPNMAKAAPLSPDLCVATGIDVAPDDDEIGHGACRYAAWDAPVLEADVCWDGQLATLKGSAPCSGKGRVYHVHNGEVLDPTTGEVAAYAPLTNACELVPCAPSYEALALEDGTACCDPNTGDCTSPDSNGMCIVGDITWCKELETHNDGTVTCHQ